MISTSCPSNRYRYSRAASGAGATASGTPRILLSVERGQAREGNAVALLLPEIAHERGEQRRADARTSP